MENIDNEITSFYSELIPEYCNKSWYEDIKRLYSIDEALYHLVYFEILPEYMRVAVSPNNNYDREKIFCFQLDNLRNRKYFCAKYLSCCAEEFTFLGDVIQIKFSGAKIYELEIMTFLCRKSSHALLEYGKKFSSYLYLLYIENEILQVYSGSRWYIYNQYIHKAGILKALIEKEEKRLAETCNFIIREMKKKGEIQSKWVSELTLYTFIKDYIPNAKYQYRTKWLEGQSFDIYLPDEKIAIEYQGVQHYTAVPYFGDEKNLRNKSKEIFKNRRKQKNIT
ncbi:MAG: hypothetical protein LKE84_00145 [Lachnospiraceae bacterium]|jgi:hypothetical protein|nr:hypothetical protein [Lachnospiraceae bacterium]